LIALSQSFQIRQGTGYIVVGPRLFPILIATGLFLLALLFLARTTSLWPDNDIAAEAAREEVATHWPTVGLALFSLVVYAFLLGPLGYTVATALFFPAVSRIMGSRKLLRDVLVGLLLGIGIFVAFTRFLGVRLPAGLLAGLF
jgi:putative tricarboxylic transport membrane protein